ncbi:MAG: SH3 domain-containing protein [Chloroflexi bacterium]|nr:SH3 domain-containing protein [Chloroflexota bacterium]
MTHMVYQPVVVLRAAPDPASELVGRVWGGMEVGVTAVSGEWSQISLAGGLMGWLPQTTLRALAALPAAEETRRQQITSFCLPVDGRPLFVGRAHSIGHRLLRPV